eukprot:g77226.t1
MQCHGYCKTEISGIFATVLIFLPSGELAMKCRINTNLVSILQIIACRMNSDHNILYAQSYYGHLYSHIAHFYIF